MQKDIAVLVTTLLFALSVTNILSSCNWHLTIAAKRLRSFPNGIVKQDGGYAFSWRALKSGLDENFFCFAIPTFKKEVF